MFVAVTAGGGGYLNISVLLRHRFNCALLRRLCPTEPHMQCVPVQQPPHWSRRDAEKPKWGREIEWEGFAALLSGWGKTVLRLAQNIRTHADANTDGDRKSGQQQRQPGEELITPSSGSHPASSR